MAKTADELFSDLQRRFIKLDRTSNRANELHALKQISRFDVEQIHSGVYLDAFVSLERFIEDLFIGYISGNITPKTNASKPIITISPASKVKIVLLGGKKFLDWLPYHNTKERAETYFSANSTFRNLSKADEQLITQLHQIRNALAHRSQHSTDIFHRLVIGNIPVTQKDKRPGNFLRTIFRANPKQSRLQNYLFEMLDLAKRLSQ